MLTAAHISIKTTGQHQQQGTTFITQKETKKKKIKEKWQIKI